MIFRYIDTMTRHVKPGVRGKPAPSLSVIQGIWDHLIQILTFRHRNLTDEYGNYEILRIKVHLDQLVKRGLLIKGTWFRKAWVGFVILQRIIYEWIEVALNDGCLSWDCILLKALSVILQSAVAGRAGDVARSALYKGVEYLKYEDVELTLSSREPLSVQHLSGKLTLKYRKDRK
jgi:hypothetical protein